MPPDSLPNRISSLTDDDAKASTSAFHVALIQDPAIPGLVSLQECGHAGRAAPPGGRLRKPRIKRLLGAMVVMLRPACPLHRACQEARAQGAEDMDHLPCLSHHPGASNCCLCGLWTAH